MYIPYLSTEYCKILRTSYPALNVECENLSNVVLLSSTVQNVICQIFKNFIIFVH